MFLCLESAQRVKLFIYLFIYFFTFSDSMVRRECYFFFSKILHFPGFHCPQSSKFVFFWNCSLSRTPSCSESAKLIFSILPFLGFHRARGAKFDLLDSFAFFHRPQSVMYIVPVCFFNSCNPVMCYKFLRIFTPIVRYIAFFPLGSVVPVCVCVRNSFSNSCNQLTAPTSSN